MCYQAASSSVSSEFSNVPSPISLPKVEHGKPIIIAYRENSVYNRLVPRIVEECNKNGRHVEILSFPEGTEPEFIREDMRSSHSAFNGCDIICDLTVLHSWSPRNCTKSTYTVLREGVLTDLFSEVVVGLVKRQFFLEGQNGNGNHKSPATLSPIDLRLDELNEHGAQVTKLFKHLFNTHKPEQIVLFPFNLMQHPPFLQYYHEVFTSFLAASDGAHKGIRPSYFKYFKKTGCINSSSIFAHSIISPDLKQRIEQTLNRKVLAPHEFIALWLAKAGYNPSRITVASSEELPNLLTSRLKDNVWLLGDRHFLTDQNLASRLREELGIERGGLNPHYLLGMPKVRLKALRFPIESLLYDLEYQDMTPEDDPLNLDTLAEALTKALLEKLSTSSSKT